MLTDLQKEIAEEQKETGDGGSVDESEGSYESEEEDETPAGISGMLSSWFSGSGNTE